MGSEITPRGRSEPLQVTFQQLPDQSNIIFHDRAKIGMQEVKDTKQATVRITYDGRVHKRYHGPGARKRFENEVRVLRYLERQHCPFVPRLLKAEDADLSIVTTSCGRVVDRISKTKLSALFCELEQYGVRHEDAFARNVTYDQRLGRFCLIDFEFATILATGEGLTLEDLKADHDPRKSRLEQESEYE